MIKNLINSLSIRASMMMGHSSIMMGAGEREEALTLILVRKPTSDINHFWHMNPSDCQGNLPSCAGYALCNLLEYHIRKNKLDDGLKMGWQLDGRRVWHEALHKTGRSRTGLTFIELLEGARGKILPNDISYRRLYPNEIFNTLKERPLLTAVRVTTNWSNPNSRTGYVRPGGRFREHHAVVLGGVSAVKYTHGPFIHFMNSWGRNNGVDGIITLDWAQFLDKLSLVYDVDIGSFLINTNWRQYIV